ncbi:MAG: GNAT family N-acetyltransferase [Acidimicrobiia bacterium]|nr:GNAT family N-acetyltransferase [Acidimicrobiia bacterium]
MPVDPDATNDTPVMTTARLELSFGTAADDAVLFPYVHGEGGRAITDLLIWDGPDKPGDMTESFKLHTTGTLGKDGFHWLLRDRDGSLTGSAGEAIGAIGVRTTDEPEICDVGYWLAQPFWGKGLMGEAIAAVAEHALDHLGFAAVAADVFATNHRSARLLEKLGFTQEGEMPAYNIKRGCPVDGLHYVLRAGAAGTN